MKISKIIFSHFFLIIFLILILSALYFISMTKLTQLTVFLSGSVYYAVWGIGHHLSEGRSDKHIFFEYILLGLIGLILTLIVFFPFM